jgi:hypothetical protein
MVYKTRFIFIEEKDYVLKVYYWIKIFLVASTPGFK